MAIRRRSTSVDTAAACGRRIGPRSPRGILPACRKVRQLRRPAASVSVACSACWPAAGDTTMPTAPGPTCAPIAAPSSLTNSSAQRGQPLAAARRPAARPARVRRGGGRRPTTGPSPAASTARCTSRVSARAKVRTFSSGTTCPSRMCSSGLTDSAEPSTAAAADPMRPPRRRCSRVSTTKNVRVAAAVVRATVGDLRRLRPPRRRPAPPPGPRNRRPSPPTASRPRSRGARRPARRPAGRRPRCRTVPPTGGWRRCVRPRSSRRRR